MKLHDIALGILVVVLGVAVVLISRDFPSMAHFRYGPGFFPGLIGLLLVIFGLILTVQGVIARAGEGLVTLAGWTADPARVLNLALIALAVVFFALAVDQLGFLPTGFLLLFATIWRLWGKPGKSLVVAVVATVVTQQAFGELLQVPLPWGLLENWSGTLTWR